jgi:hypothetical protein
MEIRDFDAHDQLVAAGMTLCVFALVLAQNRNIRLRGVPLPVLRSHFDRQLIPQHGSSEDVRQPIIQPVKGVAMAGGGLVLIDQVSRNEFVAAFQDSGLLHQFGFVAGEAPVVGRIDQIAAIGGDIGGEHRSLVELGRK